MVTRGAEDWYAQRVPSLLNINLTAPYGHAGTFESLESVIQYHANPRAEVEAYDFTLRQLPQFINLDVTYPDAQLATLGLINHQSFNVAEHLLPRRALAQEELDEVIEFLRALTDQCAGSVTCTSAWTPPAEEDPDGHMLGADNGPAPDIRADVEVVEPGDYPQEISLNWPAVADRVNFSDVIDCTDGMSDSANQGLLIFIRKDSALGLAMPHGFTSESWAHQSGAIFQSAMFSGGLTATYLNDDCWPDIIFTGGDSSGLVAFESKGNQMGFYASALRFSGTKNSALYGRFTGAAVADLNGDYRREVLLGNFLQGDVVVMSKNVAGNYGDVALLPMNRNTFGISFGDIDENGYLDMFFGHWDISGVDGTAPALWWNDSGEALLPSDERSGTSSASLDQRFNFTPKFADFRNIGRQDLIISSDFGTSAVLENSGDGHFSVVSGLSSITDENGMGGAIGDINNDGTVDWFVTSIFDVDGVAEGNWGVTGNRLYKNVSNYSNILFSDITSGSGVDKGDWGWGACMADIDSDGFLDIFHVNGFGYIPQDINTNETVAAIIRIYDQLASGFIGTAPRLFMNNGDETFFDATESWGLNIPSEGRGVICFDYDRDGDIDIGLLDHSSGIQFFENQIGHGASHRFLNVRLVGAQPNTDAIGAKVYVTADVGGEHGWQRQMRISEANSNFNSQNLPDIHFGMGEANIAATLRVEWPDHSGLICTGVQTNQFLVFDQRDHSWPKFSLDAPVCLWYPDIRGQVQEALSEIRE